MFTLDNDRLSLTIYPECGARIDSLFDKQRQKEWVWHPKGYSSPSCRNDGSFDEHFEGGWEEIFPGDAETELNGYQYLDHGELWRQHWQVISQDDLHVKLQCHCEGVPVDVEKEITLDQDGVRLDYSFRNRSGQRIPFLFKLHPAIAIEEGDEIVLPNATVEPVDLEFSRIARAKTRTPFPFVQGPDETLKRIDAALPNDSETREFVYASDIDAGDARIVSRRTHSELRIGFDREKTPYVWLLESFGGWHTPSGEPMYLVLLEPSTTMPSDLVQALGDNTCAILRPHQEMKYTFHFHVVDTAHASDSSRLKNSEFAAV